MPKAFIKDKKGYLLWAAKNPGGFIVNVDEPPISPDYPMVHRATHKAMTSSKKKNHTTERFFKVCSNDIGELENWAKEKRGRPLNPSG